METLTLKSTNMEKTIEQMEIRIKERELKAKELIQKAREQSMFWQGKYLIVKNENNQLRKKIK